MINIRCFGYDGKEFSKVSARKPDSLKPQHPEDYAIPEMDGVLNGGSEFLGCDTYALYFNAYYYSPSDRTKSESYFWGVTLDGERFLRFEEE